VKLQLKIMTTLEECLGIDLQDIVVRMLGYAALQVGEDDSGVLQILSMNAS
jgi:hypothetical protein